MDGQRVFYAWNVPGTLSANVQAVFTAPCDLTLVSVQASGSNANDATLQVGTTSDTDGYLTAFAIGDSNVPVVKSAKSDFTGALLTGANAGQYPHIAAGTVVEVLVDFDGSAGTAAANLSVLLVFTEG